MATPELITQMLARTASPAPLLSPRTQEKHGKVVEFDPDGKKSRSYEAPESPPTELLGPRGFTFDGVRAGRAIRAGLSRRLAAASPMPMEDVYFHVKDLDNSKRRRRIDPAEKSAWRRYVIGGFVAVVVVLAAFGPRASLRQSGYRLEQLSKQHQSLREINRQLTMRQAMLSDVRRVTALAEARGLAAPPPERYAWQNRTIAPLMGRSELASISTNTRP